jgi:TonB family protein
MSSITFLTATSLKATIVLAVAFLVVLLLRRSAASARYFVWNSALAIILAIPVLSLSLRPWNVQFRAATVMPAAGDIVTETGTASVSTAAPQPFLGWLIPLWLCGAVAVMLRIGAGHLSIRRMLRRAGGGLDDMRCAALLGEAITQLGLRRRVQVRYSREIDVPLSYGFLRPMVLLPAESTDWSVERQRIVLLHEIVHIKRVDAVFCLIAQVTCAAYWFHPLAWLALVRFRREQEQSCDDAVVIAGTKQSTYAEHLVDLARSLSASRPVFPAALSMAETWNLEERVHALLDPRRKRRALNRRVCLAAISAILACVIPLAAVRAQNSKPVSSVSGTVYDISGAAVPNAIVLFKNTDGSNQEVVRTGPAGEYRLVTLAAGKYNLEVKAPGFAIYQKSEVVLNAGVPEQVDVKLQLGAISDTIEVVGKGPRPAPLTSGPPRRIRVGGNVQATRLLRMVKPVYAPELQAAGIEGTVLMRAVISVQGGLLGLSVINTVDPDLAKAAMDAVRQWQYAPTLLNGLPVEVATTISVNFRLEH